MDDQKCIDCGRPSKTVTCQACCLAHDDEEDDGSVVHEIFGESSGYRCRRDPSFGQAVPADKGWTRGLLS